ncbi:MAG TPA: hypothetical protein VJ691_17935 [Vicinamibacterales bacterium]|nr:hypothetical protein [Vicinamibacterales bacterium]
MRWSSVMQAVVVAAVTAAAMTWISGPEVIGQSRAGTIPRLNGKPDLNGLWQTINTANWDIQAHSARPALAMRPGPVVPIPSKEVIAFGAVGAVPGGLGVVEGDELPYTPEGLKKKQENQENWLTRDPEIKCFLPGVPRATYQPFPFQIVQSNSAFFIAHEFAGAVRNIYLKDPGPPQIDSWMGISHGVWEGDSFVVRTSGFNDQTWFDRAGNHHSDQMKVTERFTMTDADHINYSATIDDPATFTRPWTMSMPLYRRVERNAQLGQFKCVEFVTELMYGHLRKEPVK